MKLRLINDIEEIRSILEKLYSKLEIHSGKPYPVRYSGRDGAEVRLMISVNKKGFWWGKEEEKAKNKILNLFGDGAPIEDSYIRGLFEFSFSTVRHNGQFSGQFGKDDSDDTQIYLLHNGYFSGRTRAEFDMLCSKNNMIRTPAKKRDHPGYYIIASIGDDNISAAISDFVRIVTEFKTNKETNSLD